MTSIIDILAKSNIIFVFYGLPVLPTEKYNLYRKGFTQTSDKVQNREAHFHDVHDVQTFLEFILYPR